MTLHAHEPIPAILYTEGEYSEFLGRHRMEESRVTLGVQHDPCCPGEICIGAQKDGQRMDVAYIYLDRDHAHRTAIALLAAVAHIDHLEFREGRDMDSDGGWRDSHAEAFRWVYEHPEFVSWIPGYKDGPAEQADNRSVSS